MKLSSAQERVLTAMIELDTTVITMADRGGGRAFFRQEYQEKVRPRTVFALEDKGLVHNITEPEWRWRSNEWQVTEKGRAMIQGAN